MSANPTNPLQQNNDKNQDPNNLQHQQHQTINQIRNTCFSVIAIMSNIYYSHYQQQQQQIVNQQAVIDNYEQVIDQANATIIQLIMNNLLNQIEEN